MTTQFIVGYDGSDGAKRALDFALQHAQAGGAAVALAHVIDWSPFSFHTPEELSERHKVRNEELQRANDALGRAVAERGQTSAAQIETVARHGSIPETLVAIAKERGAVQIFVGRTGTASLQDRLFGSVPSALIQFAPVPVTVVP